MRLSKELQIGKAGEYLVCADLILKGFAAYLSEQGLPYDVVLDIGHRLVRIQVKTTECPRLIPQRVAKFSAYYFGLKRVGRNNKSTYIDGDADLFALVCLDTRTVGYILPDNTPTTIVFRVDNLRGSYYDERGIMNHKKAMELNGKMTKSEIAKELGIKISQVSTLLKPNHIPFKSSARYFSDIHRDQDWFKSCFSK